MQPKRIYYKEEILLETINKVYELEEKEELPIIIVEDLNSLINYLKDEEKEEVVILTNQSVFINIYGNKIIHL